MQSKTPPIRSVQVRGLFGLYDYDLPGKGQLSDASIVYGDNGVGKSTVLKMLFHLLSPAPDRNHRTTLFSVPFQSLVVHLANGAVVSAMRALADQTSPLELYIEFDSEVLAGWYYTPNERNAEHSDFEEIVEIVTNKEGERSLVVERVQRKSRLSKKPQEIGKEAFSRALKIYAPVVFLLSSDRKLDSDSIPDPSDEVELRRLFLNNSPKRIPDLLMRSRQIALTQALSAAHRWITQQSVMSAKQSSTNVHSVYVNVLQHIAEPSRTPNNDAERPNPSELVNRIDRVTSRSSELAVYELASSHSMDELKRALQSEDSKIRTLSSDLLVPYVESLEGRVRAIEPVYFVIDQFVTIANSLLRDKSISFRLGSGFRITNIAGVDLEVEQLSSGEQQLLLLFCYILIGRDTSSVFMIDEPEISLNVKWQRKLVSSLLDLTSGADIQFLLASHSLELLAQHRERVVNLNNVK